MLSSIDCVAKGNLVFTRKVQFLWSMDELFLRRIQLLFKKQTAIQFNKWTWQQDTVPKIVKFDWIFNTWSRHSDAACVRYFSIHFTFHYLSQSVNCFTSHLDKFEISFESTGSSAIINEMERTRFGEMISLSIFMMRKVGKSQVEKSFIWWFFILFLIFSFKQTFHLKCLLSVENHKSSFIFKIHCEFLRFQSQLLLISHNDLERWSLNEKI